MSEDTRKACEELVETIEMLKAPRVVADYALRFVPDFSERQLAEAYITELFAKYLV